MKTLQQALDAMDPVIVARRRRERAREHKIGDGRDGYYFPGGKTTWTEIMRDEGYPRPRCARPVQVDGVNITRTGEYSLWMADPENTKKYVRLFYLANHIKV